MPLIGIGTDAAMASGGVWVPAAYRAEGWQRLQPWAAFARSGMMKRCRTHVAALPMMPNEEDTDVSITQDTDATCHRDRPVDSPGMADEDETFIELQDMATMTDLIYQEAARSADVQAEIFGIKGRFQAVLAPLMSRGAHCTILEALQPILEAHPGMWPGMALYWLRRHAASEATNVYSVHTPALAPRR